MINKIIIKEALNNLVPEIKKTIDNLNEVKKIEIKERDPFRSDIIIYGEEEEKIVSLFAEKYIELLK